MTAAAVANIIVAIAIVALLAFVILRMTRRS